MNLSTGTPISQLPTGTIDSLSAVIPISIGMPSSPQTIRSELSAIWQLVNSQRAGIPQDHISGLKIRYISSGSVQVDTGGAYIPSLNRVLNVTGTITKSWTTAISSTASGTWQNVFLYEDATGSPNIEITGASVSSSYIGQAKTKSTDNSRRYIGSLLYDSGGWLFRFDSNVVGNALEMNWVHQNDGSPFFVGSTTGTTPQTFGISHIIPATGLADALDVVAVVTAPAATAWVAGIGNQILNFVANPPQSAELYIRIDNQSASAVTYFLPGKWVKITSNILQAILSSGLVTLVGRIKGIRFPR